MTIRQNIFDALDEARRTENKQDRAILILAVDTIQKTEKELGAGATEDKLIKALYKLSDALTEEKDGFAKRGDTDRVNALTEQKALLDSLLPEKPVMLSAEEVSAQWQDFIDYTTGKYGFSVADITKGEYIRDAIEFFEGRAEKRVVSQIANKNYR